jgi:hypothetical protein
MGRISMGIDVSKPENQRRFYTIARGENGATAPQTGMVIRQLIYKRSLSLIHRETKTLPNDRHRTISILTAAAKLESNQKKLMPLV